MIIRLEVCDSKTIAVERMHELAEILRQGKLTDLGGVFVDRAVIRPDGTRAGLWAVYAHNYWRKESA